MPDVATSESPEWWRDRLYTRLVARLHNLQQADQWYSGPHVVPTGYKNAQRVLQTLQTAANANFLSLLVDAAHERMHPQGFRIDGENSTDIWDIWQGNELDAGSEQVFLESMALGESSLLVDPARNQFGYPTVTPEHPAQTIVAYRPGSRTVRAAGLKVWLDDWPTPPVLMAMLYLPDRVYAWSAPVSDQTRTDPAWNWDWPYVYYPQTGPFDQANAVTPSWTAEDALGGKNELGEVPLVDFQCRPRMLKPGSPEFTPVIPVQQRINKTILDRLINQEFGAFKQKWVTGMELPVDPLTGNPREPFNVSVDRLFVAESELTKFGQFQPEDLDPLLRAVNDDVQHMAAIVPTPPHYLLGTLVNLSAEALKAAEAALVSRVRRHMRNYEEPLETVARLMLKAAGKSVPNVSGMETVWRNPEFRTEAELTDALIKMASIGVPQEALWERWGATPQEIDRWKKMAPSLPPIVARETITGTTVQPSSDVQPNDGRVPVIEPPALATQVATPKPPAK